MESFHDPTEEPTKETMVDEHQSAEYSIAEWKCKSSLQRVNLVKDYDLFVLIK